MGAVGAPAQRRPMGLCSHLAHLWATSDSAPRSEALGTPQAAGGYVATLPTCGPPVILPPALKQWGPPKRQGLCSHLAHLCTTSDFAPHSEGKAEEKEMVVNWPGKKNNSKRSHHEMDAEDGGDVVEGPPRASTTPAPHPKRIKSSGSSSSSSSSSEASSGAERSRPLQSVGGTKCLVGSQRRGRPPQHMILIAHQVKVSYFSKGFFLFPCLPVPPHPC